MGRRRLLALGVTLGCLLLGGCVETSDWLGFTEPDNTVAAPAETPAAPPAETPVASTPTDDAAKFCRGFARSEVFSASEHGPLVAGGADRLASESFSSCMLEMANSTR